MASQTKTTLSQKIDKLLFRSIVFVFIALCAYFIAAHYWLLGFTSWDGLSYRIPPIVEFVQHGNLGGWKFNYPPAIYAYPFFEWVHVPFLLLFGLKGLYFSFSTLLLPFSILSVYLFVRVLTDSTRWAMYSALAYLAIPFVNTQPFSGYIDFAVIGALAFFLYALMRVLRSDKPSVRALSILSLATFIFSMSRQQAPYIAILIMSVLTFWYSASWGRDLPSEGGGWTSFRRMAFLLITFGIGIAPSAILHVSRYLIYGSPIYPYQFSFYGVVSKVGIAQSEVARAAGLIAPGWQGLLASFSRGWLFPDEWPRDFYDSRILGAGIFFHLTWITLPIYERMMKKSTVLVLALFGGIAIMVQDFWLPRWSMTLVLAVVICVGGALSWLASNGPSWVYVILLSAVCLHFGRPLYDVYTMIELRRTSIRINISESPIFLTDEVAEGEKLLYPDIGADFLVVPPVDHEFSLLLYGRNLSNQIVGVLRPSDIGDDCVVPDRGIPGRQTLIVDHQGKLSQLSDTCEWSCEYSTEKRCLAGRLVKVEQRGFPIQDTGQLVYSERLRLR
jgi:hypothetical protein